MKHLTAVISGKGGVGKTMLTAALGVAEAHGGKRVLLLDLDMGMGNLDLALGLSPKYSMLGLVAGKCREKDAVQHVTEGLDFLAAHFKRDWRDIKKSEVAQILEDYADEYDLVLMDCPAGRGKGVEFVRQFAESFLLVIGPSKASVLNARRTAQMLGNADIYAVYNDFTADSAFSFKDARAATKIFAFGGIIPHSEEANRMIQEGRMSAFSPTSIFGKAVISALKEIDGDTEFSPEMAEAFLTEEKQMMPAADSALHPMSKLHRAGLSSRYGRRGMR